VPWEPQNIVYLKIMVPQRHFTFLKGDEHNESTPKDG
jgi:hypothetical protein